MGATGRNDVSGEGRPVRSIRISAGRIVDHGGGRAQIAGAHWSRWDCVETRGEAAIRAPLVAQKIEKLVLDDRPTHASSVLVVDEFRDLLIGGQEEGPRRVPVPDV